MKKNSILPIGFLVLIIASLFLIDTTLAQELPKASDQLQNLNVGGGFGQARDPRLIVAILIRYALGMLGIAFVGYMIYGGYLMFSSRGEQQYIEEGRKTLIRATIGLIVIMSAYSITLLVTSIINGESARDGNFIRIQEDRSRFFNPDPLNENTNSVTPFDCDLQADGTCRVL